jgi:3-oxoacyl-[acyl-carrier-protein] synthase II
MSRRVVITGIGSINPLGKDVESTWKNLLAGKSGVKKLCFDNWEGIRCEIGAMLTDFDPSEYNIDSKIANKMDVYQQLAFSACQEAAKQAGIPMRHPEIHEQPIPGFEEMKPAVEDSFRMGVMLGIGVGGMKTFQDQVEILVTRGARRVSPFLIPKMIANLAGGWIAQGTGANGVNTCYVTACASGTNAIGESFLAIQHDRADIIITGGVESTGNQTGYAGFSNMHALSTRNDEPEKASRPFDKDRTGFVMGEGGAILVLEELEHAKKRGANILGEIVGYGLTADAFHITSPEPSGVGAVQAIKEAIRLAGIKPEDIDYINAHGTSTKANDRMETNAIKTVFGDHAYKLCVSSTKSMTGHLLGGAGALEAMVLLKTLQEDKIPPTINLDTPDEGMDLDYVPHKMKEREVNYAMSNSFGFGGHNAVIILKKYKD